MVTTIYSSYYASIYGYLIVIMGWLLVFFGIDEWFWSLR
jgi:hypothetical protein